jgi:ABC-type Fe3+-hydroxamate transport system substrate-binding protein
MSPLTITDDLGFAVSLDRSPQRVVSLVPSLTETLVRAGIGGRLAGVTDYCIHPASALAALPRVGGTKNVDVEAVLALDPDLVIANAEENEKPEIEAIKKETAVFVTFPKTVARAIATVENLGVLTGLTEASSLWADTCRGLYETARRDHSRERLRTVCLIWRAPWMAAGAETYMSDLMETCGFRNLCSSAAGRYPETTLERIGAARPDVILLPDEPYRFDPAHKEEIARALADRDLFPRIVLLDGTLLAWFGWRTRDALSSLVSLRKSLEEQ